MNAPDTTQIHIPRKVQIPLLPALGLLAAMFVVAVAAMLFLGRGGGTAAVAPAAQVLAPQVVTLPPPSTVTALGPVTATTTPAPLTVTALRALAGRTAVVTLTATLHATATRDVLTTATLTPAPTTLTETPATKTSTTTETRTSTTTTTTTTPATVTVTETRTVAITPSTTVPGPTISKTS